MNFENAIRLSRKNLDKIYSKGSYLEYPNGFYKGKPLFFLFNLKLTPINFLINLIWRGKQFNEKGRLLSNKIFSLNIFYGRYYLEKSKFDSKPAITLNYYKSSVIGFLVKDEIRKIGDNLYLGRAYFLGKFICYFVLAS